MSAGPLTELDLRRTAAALTGSVAGGDAALAAVLARPPVLGGAPALLRTLVRRVVRQAPPDPRAPQDVPAGPPADLLDALAGLPLAERALLLLVDLHGEPLPRAARAVGCGTAEAARLRHRALEVLGESLGEDLSEHGEGGGDRTGEGGGVWDGVVDLDELA